jgi:hypothetical protein
VLYNDTNVFFAFVYEKIQLTRLTAEKNDHEVDQLEIRSAKVYIQPCQFNGA